MSDDTTTKPTEPSTPTPAQPTPASPDSQVTQPNQVQASDAKPTDSTDNTPANTDGATPSGDTPAATEAEEYEIEIGEDSPLTEADLEEIVAEAARLKLPKEEADKLIATREKMYKAGLTKAQAEYQAKIDQQRQQIMADPMFSKENAPATFQSMSRAIETFGDEDMVKLVQSAEFGNNVVLARFLKKIGDVLKPDSDSMTGGKGSAGPSQSEVNDTLRAMYPDFYKDQK